MYFLRTPRATPPHGGEMRSEEASAGWEQMLFAPLSPISCPLSLMPLAALASTAARTLLRLATQPKAGSVPRRRSWRTPPSTGPTRAQAPRRATRTRAREDEDESGPLATAARAADSAADALAGFLPDSIPRGAAKVGILVVGGAVLLSVVGKVISTVAFVGALGAGGWLLLQSQNSDPGSGGNKKGSGGGGGSASDALAEARRLMKKYK